tara:strand:- start:648 stop:1556 length:909 start_codon:yes stop_codon:yes gene_type:complete
VLNNFKLLSKKLKSKFYFNYNICNYTWFKTGGKAELFCLVFDEEELKIILQNLDKSLPLVVIGAGSNILIRDGGFKGLILKLGKGFNTLDSEQNLIKAGSAILDSNLSKYALNNSIGGFEFFSGIPGSVGGAIKMNAGCFGSETKDIVKKIYLFDRSGIKKKLDNREIGFSYRYSKLSESDVVISAIFKGKYTEKNEIESKINEIKNNREISQPLKTKTGGSSFKNPKGNYAAKLIEEADCKGLVVGGAMVSNKHSNFIINLGNATANDIENLGKILQNKVMQKTNIFLEWEIKIIGDLIEK